MWLCGNMGINYCLIAIYKKREFVENESNPWYGFFSNLYAAMFEHSVKTN